MRLASLRRPGLPRGFGTWLAVLALLLQIGVTQTLDPTGLMGSEAGFFGPLCHAVSDQSHGTGPASPGKALPCPLCLALQAASALLGPPPPAHVFIGPAAPRMALSASPCAGSVLHEANVAARPRAPPALV